MRPGAVSGLDLERIYVILVALHSFIIGLMLLFAPRWSAAFGGWDQVEPTFFVRQGGAFHLVVAFAYVVEHFRARSVTILVTAKTIGVVFLTACALCFAVPWAVWVSAVGDGLMAVAALLVHRWQLARR